MADYDADYEREALAFFGEEFAGLGDRAVAWLRGALHGDAGREGPAEDAGPVPDGPEGEAMRRR